MPIPDTAFNQLVNGTHRPVGHRVSGALPCLAHSHPRPGSASPPSIPVMSPPHPSEDATRVRGVSVFTEPPPANTAGGTMHPYRRRPHLPQRLRGAGVRGAGPCRCVRSARILVAQEVAYAADSAPLAGPAGPLFMRGQRGRSGLPERPGWRPRRPDRPGRSAGRGWRLGLERSLGRRRRRRRIGWRRRLRRQRLTIPAADAESNLQVHRTSRFIEPGGLFVGPWWLETSRSGDVVARRQPEPRRVSAGGTRTGRLACARRRSSMRRSHPRRTRHWRASRTAPPGSSAAHPGRSARPRSRP